jgi:hypothetical protein
MFCLCIATEKSKHFSKVRQRHISADSSYSTASSIGYESDEAPKKAKISSRNRPKTGDHLTRPINEKVKNDRNIWIEQEHASHKNDNFPQIKVTRNTLRPKEPPNYDNSSHISSTGLLVIKCIYFILKLNAYFYICSHYNAVIL